MKRMTWTGAIFGLAAGLLLTAPDAQAIQSLTHPICESGNPVSREHGVADSCTWLEATVYFWESVEVETDNFVEYVQARVDSNCKVSVTKGGQSSTIHMGDTQFSWLRFDSGPTRRGWYETEFTVKAKLPTGCALAVQASYRLTIGRWRTIDFAVDKDQIAGTTTKMKFNLHNSNVTRTEVVQ